MRKFLTALLLFSIYSLSQAQILDPNFKPNLNTNGFINDIEVQSDGKILVGGQFTEINGVSANGIARLNTDGTLDQAFLRNIGSGVSNNFIIRFDLEIPRVNDIALQKDGKIILCGFFENFNNLLRVNMVRLNPDGTLDISFNQNGVGFPREPEGLIKKLAVQSDNKIIILTEAVRSYNNVNLSFKNTFRVNADGSFDNTFPVQSFTRTILVLQDDRIVIGGSFASGESVLLLTKDGQLVRNLGAVTNQVMSLALDNTGKVVVGGIFSDYNGITRNNLAKVDLNGVLDNTFAPVISGSVESIATQSDGKVIAAGEFNQVNGVSRPFLCRLNANGTNDNTFTTTVNQRVFSLVVLANKQIILGGKFTLVNAQTFNLAGVNENGAFNAGFQNKFFARYLNLNVINENASKQLLVGSTSIFFRFNADGSPDNAFNTNFNKSIATNSNQFIHTVYTFEILKDNKILVAYEPLTGGQYFVKRLLSDGNVDPAFTFFNTDLPVRGFFKGFLRTIIVGEFNTVQGQPRQKIASIEDNGALNNLILPPSFDNTVYQYDSLLTFAQVAVGTFRSYQGTPKNSLVMTEPFDNFRISLSDNYVNQFGNQVSTSIYKFIQTKRGDIFFIGDIGVVNNLPVYGFFKTRNFIYDPSFKFKLDIAGFVNDIALQKIGGEGKILLCGYFPNQPAVNRYLVRLNEDGSFDESFRPNINLDRPINKILVTSDNHIILNGNFPGSLVRLLTPQTPAKPTELKASSLFGREINLRWKTTAGNATGFVIQRSLVSGDNFENLGFAESGDTSFTDRNIQVNVQYFYRLKAINNGNASEFSNEASIFITPLITSLSSENKVTPRIYPNPNNGYFRLEKNVYSLTYPKGTQWEVYDARGNRLTKGVFIKEKEEDIHLPGLAAGLYFLKLDNGINQTIIKWIKE